MKIFCMSDIHGCLAEFEVALSLVMEHLEEAETMLILMGDYIHGGSDNYGVLDKIMKLQNRYGLDKVLALMGNHEEFVLWGDSTINHMIKTFDEEQFIDEGMEDKYEIVYASDEDLRLTKDGVIEKFEREIAKKKNEAQDLENQLTYFINHFVKGRGKEDAGNRE